MKVKCKDSFSLVPVLWNKNLTLDEVGLITIILQLHSYSVDTRGEEIVAFSRSRIASQVGSDKRRITKLLNSLQDKGYLWWRDPGKHQPTRVKLNYSQLGIEVTADEEENNKHTGDEPQSRGQYKRKLN